MFALGQFRAMRNNFSEIQKSPEKAHLLYQRVEGDFRGFKTLIYILEEYEGGGGRWRDDNCVDGCIDARVVVMMVVAVVLVAMAMVMMVGAVEERRCERGGRIYSTSTFNKPSNLRISSNPKGTGIKSYNGGGNGESQGSSLKRQYETSPPPGQPGQPGGGDTQGDGKSSDHLRKKPRKERKGKGKATNRRNRPFGCPFFKHNPSMDADCAGWNNTSLTEVKEHCKKTHIKHLRCGRCKVFQAGSHNEVTEHLEEDDCEKGEILDPNSQEEDKQKAKNIDKAPTWEKVYGILFELHIPSPFWDVPAETPEPILPADIPAGPIFSLPNDPPMLEWDYQDYFGIYRREHLAGFLAHHLGPGHNKEFLDNLLAEYSNQPAYMHDIISNGEFIGDPGYYSRGGPIPYQENDPDVHGESSEVSRQLGRF